MHKKLRIGIITHNYPSSSTDRQNAGIFVYDLVQELAKHNDVFVYCPGTTNARVKIGKTSVQWFKWRQGAKLGSLKIWSPLDVIEFFTFFFQGFKNLNQWYQSSKPDVVIAMWSFPAGWFAYRLKQKYDVPYAAWSLGSDIYIYATKPFAKQLIQKILREAKWLFADGIDLARRVEAFSGKQCIFLPSASKIVVPSKNSGAKGKKDSSCIVITFVGRLEPVKGPDILIDALTKLKSRKNYRVNILGGGSLLEALQSRVQDVGLDTTVTLFGNVSDKLKIASVIQASDWLVIPDRSGSIPLVFSESMKVKTPVIVADLPDLQYLVKEYNIGYIFTQGDSDGLARIIEDLPNRRKQRALFVANTKKAAKLFSIEESARRLKSFFDYVK